MNHQQCREMFRHCRVKLLLAALLAFQLALLVLVTVVTVVTQDWHFVDLSRFSAGDDSTNETLNTFLAEYEIYCSSQMIPKTSIATRTVFSSSLCDCVPHTLGKCLYLQLE